MIDDHEIVGFLGEDHYLPPSDIINTLLTQTEVGNWGESKRFRPSYYFVRLMLTSLFGDSATLYFITQVILMTFTSALIGFYFYRLFAQLENSTRIFFALFGTLTVNLLPVWADVVVRLGPSEAMQAFTIAVFMNLMLLAVRSIDKPVYWLAIPFLCGFASGLKENMAIFYLFAVSLFALYRKRVTSNRALLLTYIFSGIFILLIELGPILAIQKGSKTDIYGHSRSMSQIIELLESMIISPHILVAILMSLISFCINRYGMAWPNAELGITIFFCDLVLISDYVFYEGNVRGNRYSMLTQLSLMIIFFLTLAQISSLKHSRTTLKWSRYMPGFAILVTIGVLIHPHFSNKNALSIYKSASSVYTKSNLFQRELDQISSNSNVYNRYLLMAQSSWDYEPIAALTTYLHNIQPESLFELKLLNPSVTDELSRMLVESMQDKAIHGDSKWHIIPNSGDEHNGAYICLYIGSIPEQNESCLKEFVVTSP